MKLPKRKKTNENQGRNVRSASRHAPVFSYYSQRSVDQGETSRRVSPQETIRIKAVSPWVKYLPSIFSLILVFFATLYLTTLSSEPRMILLNPGKESIVPQPVKVYQSAATDLFRESLLSQSKFTINTDEIARKLKSQFPELGDVVITIPLFGRNPIIEARPAEPRLILSGDGGSFIIDADGIPVLRADQLVSAKRDKLPVVSDNSGTTIELGKKILPNDLVVFITSLKAQFEAKGLTVESYTFPALSNELHVRIAGEGYYIKFNTEADARLQAGTYFALKELLANENKTPAEYVDVRVEERAYYK